ncbi:MAG TPA: TSUP family transporter, partial [Candidatus Tumulicola sp.]|nr:TSUP family transporter [Candidatus Tumulicola sp.]
MDWTLLAVLLVVGGLVGFLAGLLGIGGGLSMIPLLTIVFSVRAFPPGHVVHMAVATSTATMMFTAASSAHAHARRGGVLWGVVAAMAPGIVLGSLIGPQISAILPGRVLAAVLGAFTWTAATRMTAARASRPGRTLPGRSSLFGVAA